MKRQAVLFAWLLVAGLGCAEVIGTADLCDEETCEGGGGSGGGTGSTTGTGSSTGSGSTGTAGCVDLTVDVVASVEVKLEGGPDVDWSAGGLATQCIPPGNIQLRAECAEGENKGEPVMVEWGNAICPAATTCSFALAQPTTFDVALAGGASCPP